MTRQCCALHTNTCGHLDVCCDQCPTLRGPDVLQLLTAIAGVLLLALWGVALS